MKMSLIHLERLYNCTWISQSTYSGKIILECNHCGGNESKSVSGQKLNVLMEFYNEFFKAHHFCENDKAVEKLKSQMEELLGKKIGPIVVKDQDE